MTYPGYGPNLYGSPIQPPYSPMQPFPPVQQGGGQMPQQSGPAQPQPAFQGLSPASRPVSSKEEAMGIAADFSGSLMLFPDISNNRIYLKRWNVNNGSADFVEFAPAPQPVVEAEQGQPNAAYAALQDFQDLQETVEQLKKELEKVKRPSAVARPVKKEKGQPANE